MPQTPLINTQLLYGSGSLPERGPRPQKLYSSAKWIQCRRLLFATSNKLPKPEDAEKLLRYFVFPAASIGVGVRAASTSIQGRRVQIHHHQKKKKSDDAQIVDILQKKDRSNLRSHPSPTAFFLSPFPYISGIRLNKCRKSRIQTRQTRGEIFFLETDCSIPPTRRRDGENLLNDDDDDDDEGRKLLEDRGENPC